MVRVWYMDKSTEDQRLPHMLDPQEYMTLEELNAKTGVEHFQVIWKIVKDLGRDSQRFLLKYNIYGYIFTATCVVIFNGTTNVVLNYK